MSFMTTIIIYCLAAVFITIGVTFLIKHFSKKTAMLLIPSFVSGISLVGWITYAAVNMSKLGMGFLIVQLFVIMSFMSLLTNLIMIFIIKKRK